MTTTRKCRAIVFLLMAGLIVVLALATVCLAVTLRNSEAVAGCFLKK